MKHGSWNQPDWLPQNVHLPNMAPLRSPNNWPNIGRTTNVRQIPMSEVHRGYVSRLLKSGDKSSIKMGEELKKIFDESDIMQMKWLRVWTDIRDFDDMIVKKYTNQWKEGRRDINFALYMGNAITRYLHSRGYKREPRENISGQAIGMALLKTNIHDFTESVEYRQMLLDREFCLDFSRDRFITHLKDNELFTKIISPEYQYGKQPISKYFIDYLQNSKNEMMRMKVFSRLVSLNCSSGETPINWQCIWKEIKNDFLKYMDQNTAEGRRSIEIIEKAISVAQPRSQDAKISIVKECNDEDIEEMKKTHANLTIYPVLIGIWIPAVALLMIGLGWYRRHKSLSFHLQIDFSQFTIMDHVGSGNFAQVYLVHYQPNMTCRIPCSRPFTVKAAAKLLVPQIVGSNQEVEPSVFAGALDCSVDEIKVRDLKHKNIVKVFGLCTNFDTRPYIPTGVTPRIPVEECATIATIFEYMDLGDLEHYLPKYCNFSKSPHMAGRKLQTVCSILIDITDAFLFLQSKKIVHRDLAARNILLQSRRFGYPIAKLADFGLAKMANQQKKIGDHVFWAYIGMRNEELDPANLAPEVNEKLLFTSLSDVYAFGYLIPKCIGSMQNSEGTIQEEHRCQVVRNGYALVQGMDKNRGTQANSIEWSERSVTSSSSSTVYFPVQPVQIPTVCEMIQYVNPYVQNMAEETSFSSSIATSHDQLLSTHEQEVIDQFFELASSCMKPKIDTRITFEKLRTGLATLRKISPKHSWKNHYGLGKAESQVTLV